MGAPRARNLRAQAHRNPPRPALAALLRQALKVAHLQQHLARVLASVEAVDALDVLLEAAGAQKINTIELASTAYFEAKFQGPEDIVVDIGHWVGTGPIDK